MRKGEKEWRQQIRRALPGWLLRRLIPFEWELERRAGEFCRRQEGLLLDAAGGSGRYAPGAVALDLNRAALIERGGLAVCADIHELPFRDHSLDAVCCSAALHHFADSRLALTELRRCLRSGGRLFLTVPDRFPATDQPDDYRRFSRAGICRLLEECGWQVESCRPIGGRCWVASRCALERLFSWLRPSRLPLFLLGAPVLGLAMPMACYYLDREEEETLGWEVVGKKKEAGGRRQEAGRNQRVAVAPFASLRLCAKLSLRTEKP